MNTGVRTLWQKSTNHDGLIHEFEPGFASELMICCKRRSTNEQWLTPLYPETLLVTQSICCQSILKTNLLRFLILTST